MTEEEIDAEVEKTLTRGLQAFRAIAAKGAEVERTHGPHSASHKRVVASAQALLDDLRGLAEAEGYSPQQFEARLQASGRRLS